MLSRFLHTKKRFLFSLLIAVLCLQPGPVSAVEPNLEEVPDEQQFLNYVLKTFYESREKDSIPGTLSEWKQIRQNLRHKIAENIGLYEEPQCELNPELITTIDQEGYRIEKILLSTFPDIKAPVLAYVPDGEGPFPAVLCVHGHWKGAKQEPAIQSRCIGLAKLGFFVLAVDAFGAGERGLGKALGEYHGAAVGATLFPSGRLLPGLQIYENSRFVDYLQFRPEVIDDKIGITGASGGGNQTMYAGAMEERFQAVVPVCSVGTYRSYLGAACCYCELLPGTMKYTEEWALLSMTAPRGLMIINATRDAIQFSPEEATKSIAASKPIFAMFGKEQNLKHVIFESKHDYNKEMREAMYGWMTLQLKGEGNGDPIPEPEHQTLEPEELRIYPGESRPDDFTTLLDFAQSRSQKLVDRKNNGWNAGSWNSQKEDLKDSLERKLNSRYSRNSFSSLNIKAENEDQIELTVQPEPVIEIASTFRKGNSRKLAILINLDNPEEEAIIKLKESLSGENWSVMFPELRSTGRYRIPRDQIGEAVDHNSVEWALWNGIPLLGQWVTDVRSLIDVAETIEKTTYDKVVLTGFKSGAIVAVVSGVLDSRVTGVTCHEMLSSFVPNHPFAHDRIGILVPGILREVGDVSHLCGLFAPRKLMIHEGHLSDGKPLSLDDLEKIFSPTGKSYGWEEAENQFQILSGE